MPPNKRDLTPQQKKDAASASRQQAAGQKAPPPGNAGVGAKYQPGQQPSPGHSGGGPQNQSGQGGFSGRVPNSTPPAGEGQRPPAVNPSAPNSGATANDASAPAHPDGSVAGLQADGSTPKAGSSASNPRSPGR